MESPAPAVNEQVKKDAQQAAVSALRRLVEILKETDPASSTPSSRLTEQQFNTILAVLRDSFSAEGLAQLMQRRSNGNPGFGAGF